MIAREQIEACTGCHEHVFARRLVSQLLFDAAFHAPPTILCDASQQREFIGKIPIHSAVINSRGARKLAQAERLDVSCLELRDCGPDQGFRQVPVAEGLTGFLPAGGPYCPHLSRSRIAAIP